MLGVVEFLLLIWFDFRAAGEGVEEELFTSLTRRDREREKNEWID